MEGCSGCTSATIPTKGFECNMKGGSGIAYLLHFQTGKQKTEKAKVKLFTDTSILGITAKVESSYVTFIGSFHFFFHSYISVIQVFMEFEA